MYTRVIRTAVLCTLSIPALLSCAGDDDVAPNPGEPCMQGMMSTMFVGGPMDPCPQDEKDSYGKVICDQTMGYMAVTICQADGTWEYPCKCIKPVKCGNGVREATEQCDGVDMGGSTCATMIGGNAVGQLQCSSACSIITTGCMAGPAMNMNGGGGASGGGGAGG